MDTILDITLALNVEQIVCDFTREQALLGLFLSVNLSLTTIAMSLVFQTTNDYFSPGHAPGTLDTVGLVRQIIEVLNEVMIPQ